MDVEEHVVCTHSDSIIVVHKIPGKKSTFTSVVAVSVTWETPDLFYKALVEQGQNFLSKKKKDPKVSGDFYQIASILPDL